MSENNPAPGGQKPVSLQQVAQQFMSGLQRHFDMLAFNFASRDAVSESAYEQRASAPKIMPVAQIHTNFEHIQAYARDLLVRQVVGDVLNLAMNCLNNCHFFLCIVRSNKDGQGHTPAAQRQVQEAQEAFVKAQLDEKFNQLEENFGVMCELEDTMISLGFCMQAFIQQNGVVREPQVDPQGELLIELKAAKSGLSGDLKLQPEHVDTRVVKFKEGEPVVFEDVDLQLMFVTIAVFAQQLYQSVATYAQENQADA